jgi:hypothetical protein
MGIPRRLGKNVQFYMKRALRKPVCSISPKFEKYSGPPLKNKARFQLLNNFPCLCSGEFAMKREFLVICVALLLNVQIAFGQFTVEQVEEDWQLTIGEPDPEIDAPQVSASMIPFASNLDLHLQVNLNHAVKPEFASGGIQMRIMADGDLYQQVHKRAGEKLAEDSEVVRWTTLVQKQPAGYIFGISTGTSVSWGAFGGDYHFVFIPNSMAPGGLGGYAHERSLEHSGVQYAGNRVQSLRLLRTRITYSDGLVVEQQIHRDVE